MATGRRKRFLDDPGQIPGQEPIPGSSGPDTIDHSFPRGSIEFQKIRKEIYEEMRLEQEKKGVVAPKTKRKSLKKRVSWGPLTRECSINNIKLLPPTEAKHNPFPYVIECVKIKDKSHPV